MAFWFLGYFVLREVEVKSLQSAEVVHRVRLQVEVVTEVELWFGFILKPTPESQGSLGEDELLSLGKGRKGYHQHPKSPLESALCGVKANCKYFWFF